MINLRGIYKGQRGATLVVALILLLIMTLIASTAIQSNVLQSRMTANLQDQAVAFEASETALLYAEEWLASLKAEPELTDYDGWSSGDTEFVFDSRSSSSSSATLKDQLEKLSTVDDWVARAKPSSDFNSNKIARVYEQPKVSLELVQLTPDDKTRGYVYGEGSGVATFRQLSRSTGVTGNSEVVLVSEYRKRFR
ncbi:PilX N-terminal domain-containing pilus assembly protein [Amphritea pacifica]|uniref:Type 4 fimbrial biogenesis protein PilX N-terminal domain-containing protein n=1 Tax=Amphritea pacifica TaxID=2811233 RepID=A0ABS2WBG3_9GAMM|nr:PilX N-terminal domain-containing pilus assembly protein [Amphritea pacifica]MBN0989057.1 hypothetical protein [Amphritea pacifica]MBN1008029.1 hypothetical protein [Amphritea pacifica]